MTKEQRIEAFNEKSEFMYLRISNSILIQLTTIHDNEIDDLAKELTEAKEIMEAE